MYTFGTLLCLAAGYHAAIATYGYVLSLERGDRRRVIVWGFFVSMALFITFMIGACWLFLQAAN